MPLINGKSQKSFVKNLKTEMHEGKPMKQSLAIAYSMKRKAQKKKMADGGSVSEPPVLDKRGVDSLAQAFGKKMADGGQVKGVHRGAFDEEHPKDKVSKSLAGESVAGSEVRAAQHYADIHGEEKGSQQKYQEKMKKAVPEHHKVLGELKSMPNPKLKGLANGGYLENGEMYPHARNKMFDVTNKYANGGHVEEMESGYLPMPYEHSMYNEEAMQEDEKSLNQHYPNMQAETSMAEEDLVDRIMRQRSKDFSSEARYSEGGRVANQDEIEAGFMPNEFDDLHLRDDLESSYGEDDNAGDSLGNAQENEDRSDIVARIMASRRKKDRLPNPA